MKENIRVRFAPSPTGPLHIGGVRTALYNYLFAKGHGGTFILRIEDTDQNRYVEGAEDYIIEALKWLNLVPGEGVGFGGDLGPYRQSERKDMYAEYALRLVDAGHAYYAFDSDEDLKAIRAEYESRKETFKYDSTTRGEMNNSLNMPEEDWRALVQTDISYVIRLKVPEDEDIIFQDMVRGEVKFNSSQLDDKVLLKADGMPTYHMANIVDDHLMQISHVIRGEEWLPSTPTHVLLYRFLGWEDSMPAFCHLPLILKPTGKGKLSKRDGAKFGFPVFPLDWRDESTGDNYMGFREQGFTPEAVVNFLALLGWSPSDDQEIMSLDELVERFDASRINKAGARFDYDKAKWFNQQYISQTPDIELAPVVKDVLASNGYTADIGFAEKYAGLFKERVEFIAEFKYAGYYFFEDVKSYDEKNVRKRWKADNVSHFLSLKEMISGISDFSPAVIEGAIKEFMTENGLSFGVIFPILRIALTGSMSGPSVFEILSLMGKDKAVDRLATSFSHFDKLVEND
ncbi:MAG: glutamate--tRNA ligase [Bacteroidota bacterium]